MKFSSHYIALAVKNIRISVQFYEKLGFKPIHHQGSIAEQWIIMENHGTQIGLFQDMFPKNVHIYHVPDLEALIRGWDSTAIDFSIIQTGSKTTGPNHIVVVDPDGNVVLFDQCL